MREQKLSKRLSIEKLKITKLISSLEVQGGFRRVSEIKAGGSDSVVRGCPTHNDTMI